MSNRCLNKDPLLNKTFSGFFFAANLEISAEWDAEGKHEERRGGNKYFNSLEAKMALFLLELLPTN